MFFKSPQCSQCFVFGPNLCFKVSTISQALVITNTQFTYVPIPLHPSKQNTHYYPGFREKWKSNQAELLISCFQPICLISGSYAYIEASSPQAQGDNAILIMQGSGAERCMHFFYHMYGSGIGALNIYQQRRDLKEVPRLLWSRRGTQKNTWRRARVNIKASQAFWVSWVFSICKIIQWTN